MYKYLRKYIDIFSKNNRYRVFFVCAVLSLGIGNAQTNVYRDYIERFKDVALSHQQEYGIPASITLAQGILESNAGQSRLATEANNHFGIKCGGEWKGKTIKHKAENGKECFRKYDNAEESYHDHALFLKKKRYTPLFKHKVSDYKNWAKTLRECGYATDSKYPDKLINIIERYELHKLDNKGKKNSSGSLITPAEENNNDGLKKAVIAHAVHRRGNLLFIYSHEGDTYESISDEFDITKKKLLSYNDTKQKPILTEGEIVYLQEKDKEYAGDKQWYIVNEGETLYSISQKLGIRLKNLRKMNKINDNIVIQPGDTLKIK